MNRKIVLTVTPELVLLVALLVSPLAAQLASSEPLRLEAGHLLDAGTPLSFLVPDGWELKEGSSSGNINLVHNTSRSTFLLTRKPNGQDLDTEFKALKLAVPFLGGKWSKISERWRKIGGQKAGELVSKRDLPDHGAVQEWDLVVVNVGRVYLIQAQIPLAEVRTIHKDVDAMLGTLRWES